MNDNDDNNCVFFQYFNKYFFVLLLLSPLLLLVYDDILFGGYNQVVNSMDHYCIMYLDCASLIQRLFAPNAVHGSLGPAQVHDD